METRSRKRAEASSSRTPATRSSKRPRTSAAASASSSDPPVASRTRQASAGSAAAAAAAMDSDHVSGRRERRSSGRNSERDRETPADKGKEREPTEGSSRSRERDRDAERILGLSFDSGGGDDDNDSEGGVGILHQNFTSASSALQGLLRKLGAGLDDLLPSSAVSGSSSSQQSSRLKKILSGLRADGEEGRQVEALTQLCELLSIGTEDSLGSFSVDSFVPLLVGLLNHESNPDIMLLAARALTHLCDVLPTSCAAVVHYGAVPCFCARLLTIEYMDLAEQSLQALKKISQEHPTACLRAGALMAVLSYLDFFSTGVQRVALSTAANMCKKLPSDAGDFVMEAVPLLTNLLQYHDAKVLEYASVCLTRIADAFASSPDKLDELCNHGLVAQAASLISSTNSAGQASLSTSTYTGLIRLLSTCASGSPLAAKTLLLLGISGVLKDILSGSGLLATVSVSPTLSRPSEQIYEIVNLADELLPPLPQGTISIPVCSNVKSAGQKTSGSSSGKQNEASEKKNENSAREKLLQDQPELLQQFGMDLLPILTQIYGSSVNGSIRHKCLSVIGKLMYFSSAEMIQSLLGSTNISSFLAGVLGWKDLQVLIPALQIGEILMDKLPGIFAEMFVREGVVHAVDALIRSDPSNSIPSQSSPPEKDNDSVTGMSSRSRRYRRRNGGQSADGGQVDDVKSSATGSSCSPPSSESPSTNNSIRAAVSEFAKAFKDKYYPSVSGETEIGVSEDLLLLKNLCSKINASADDVKTQAKGKSKASGVQIFETSETMEEELNSVISKTLNELTKGNGVSTFEFIGSGVVVALLNYFSCGTFGKDRVSDASLPKLRQQALRRYKSFMELALPVGLQAGNGAPMGVLVWKLQKALSSLERFPVVLSHSSRSTGGSARLSSGLNALSQPFKLRLCRSQGEKSLRDYSSNIVLIDPLASLAAVEEFLWTRVQRSDSTQKSSTPAGSHEGAAPATGGSASSPGTSTPASGHRPTTRSRSSITIGGTAKRDSSEGSANSSKAKGKAVLKSTPDVGKGPQTRNAARRKEASEKDTEMKPARGDSNSEDDDLDMSPVEIDDTLMIEDDVSDDEDDDHEEVLRDESLPVCAPDKVHDVKLGDPADESPVVSAVNDGHAQPSPSTTRTAPSRGLESAEFRSGNTFISRGSLSFAAAAMAGLASVSGRGIRGGRDRRGFPHGVGASEHHNKLIFTVGGKQLSKNMTIYQAIQRQLVLDDDDDERSNGSEFMPSDGSRFWSDIFTITYHKADNQIDGSAQGGSSSSNSAKSSNSSPASVSVSDTRWQQMSLLDSILQGELPCDLEKSSPTYNILALLRVLEGLNQLASRLRVQAVSDEFAEGKITSLDELYTRGSKVPPEEFTSNKLTPKLGRQIQDALALCSGSLPSWCYQLTKACPFLFPFEIRRQYFYSTAFGLSRALHRLQQQQSAENNSAVSEREVRVGRLQRQKVRVSRNRILESAARVMEIYSSQKAVLEVEYFGEVGTGLGPTLEFYTLLSHDLQKVGLGLWRSSSSSDTSAMEVDGDGLKEAGSDDTSDGKKVGHEISAQSRDTIQAPLGLFPRPWPPSADVTEGSQFSKVVEYFRLVGRVMAKALQDGRLLDLPLSNAFYKLLLGQELDLYDILSFDAELGKILQELQIIVSRKKFLEMSGTENQRMIPDLRFRGAQIEDLCLDFSLPGYPEYVLKGEENIMVNIDNLDEYVNLVVDATVKSGILRQIEAFRAGFNQVFDISSLQTFSPHELDHLFCGRRELWEPGTLADHIKFDHGYTAKSRVIINLLEIMSEFTAEQQHAFCQFVTGAPRLPLGGLAALNPKLTIVRKHSSTATNTASNAAGASESADEDLPSVMTCANYLKLPPYSTKEIMFKKLLYAINEGQGSFDLS
ncbi:E3 ubiquitin-protein ligase UPL3 [Apostasia shenzhenica]|uniref:HECT-type E3 ubiquitin transferase n=1 Tax=Apostasia shenzhenica TaxID=1088818 RepID=A0A2I0AKD0_9ASPA|nr:E3 ubiquitin-protein ligase UPL3 [Apostasia shenzhenica]